MPSPTSFEPSFENIRISSIVLNPHNPRGVPVREDDAKFIYLRESIAEFGILVPLVVIGPLEDNRYMLIDGERRFEAAKALGINAVGPIPPDTVFLRAKEGEFDGAVAMYHDQGHIPVKMMGFMEGVNVTVGLPIIRTSVDHGTAYRRAGLRLGTGDPTSLIEAIKLAAQMAKSKFKKSLF